MFKRLMKLGIKSSLLTSAVYYTVDLGLWEDTERADEVYSQLYQAVVPYVKEVPVEVPELPSYSMRRFNNDAVVSICEFARELPTTMSSWAGSLKTSISGLLEAASTPPEEGSSTDVTSNKS